MKHLAFCLFMLCGAATLSLAAADDVKKPAGAQPAAAQPAATTGAQATTNTDTQPAAPAAAKPPEKHPVILGMPPPLTVDGKVAGAKSAEVDSLVLLEKAVARDSSKIDNLYKLGIMYLDRDRPMEAITVLSKVAIKRPNDLKVLVNLGAAQDAAGHGEFATELYRKALEIAPGDSVASCRLASSLYSRGKHQEAIDLLRSTIERAPGSFCAYFTLAIAFADAGIYRDAIRMWKKVVELAPESPEGVSAKESIEVLQKFVQP